MKAIVITLVVFLIITGVLINYLHRSIINIICAIEELVEHYKNTLNEIKQVMLEHATKIGNLEERIKNLTSASKIKNQP